MFKTRSILPLVLALLALGASAPAQTIGLPFVNDLYVDVGLTGAPVGPPGGAPCMVGPMPIPPATPFSLNVTTPTPGSTVLLFVDFGPCAPAFFPLPPVAGPYAVIPPTPFAPFTNVTWDLLPTATVALSGTTAPVPAAVGPGGMYTTAPLINPAPVPLGVLLTVQAVIFDAAAATPFGMVTTNAVELAL